MIERLFERSYKMEEEFKYLESIGEEVTIRIPKKDLEFMKILYHHIPHGKSGFPNFILLAAQKGLAPFLWEAPNHVQAQLYLLMTGKDPYVSWDEIRRESGMPETKPPKFPIKEWKSPNIWHINLDNSFWTWWGFTPRWKKP